MMRAGDLRGSKCLTPLSNGASQLVENTARGQKSKKEKKQTSYGLEEHIDL